MVEERYRSSPFVRYFDKTPEDVFCSSFYHLAWANGCPFACAYCYLMNTFRGATEPVVYSNVDKMMSDVRNWNRRHEGKVLNTGEVTDSLALPQSVPLVKMLVPFFAQSKNKVLFLTKSDKVETLLEVADAHNFRTIVSFSLNAHDVAGKWEIGAVSVDKRLAAAKAVADAKYELRLRIDPMVPVDDWQFLYGNLLSEIAGLNQNRYVSMITLGTLRWKKGVRYYARELRRDDTVFDLATKLTEADGRYRVETGVRHDMYRMMVDEIRTTMPNVRIGICKETLEMREALGFDNESRDCNCQW